MVDWEYIARMREDLIERMTSKLFEKTSFSKLIIQLCSELTKEDDLAYKRIRNNFSECIPKDFGINPYFTLDQTSKIEQVFMSLHPELNLGDSGSIEGQGGLGSSHDYQSTDRTVLAAIPEEIRSESSSQFAKRNEGANETPLESPRSVSDTTNELLGKTP